MRWWRWARRCRRRFWRVGSAAAEDLLLLDVERRCRWGSSALGGVVAKIIQRNSTIPCERDRALYERR